nr:hypothetical protein BaRGS_026208 [Batillaria attramentaria]
MRVHLRGVVIAVVVLLSLVVIVSVFNAYDSKPTRGRTGRQAGRQNRNLATNDDDDDDDDDDEEEEADASPRGRKNSPKARSRHVHIVVARPAYPDWWKTSYPRSAVYGKDKEFVGDQPLFPECPVFEKDSPKMQRFGYVEPQNYMANSKNPCWFEFNGKKDLLKCVPYFYVAGVAKSGTADLLTRVRNHPQVISGSTIAYHWWDRQRYGAPATLKYTKEARRPQDPMPLKEYAKQVVETGGKNVTRELLYHGKSNIIFGDGSPTYLVENTQWTVFEGNQGCNEPRILPATFIRHMFPDSRIILMLRHPVVRLYSRFLANVPPVPEFENRTASLFHTFCVQAVQIYQECFARASIRQCAYNSTLFSNAVVRLSEGMYPIFLEDWFRIFPREQLLIFRFEDYVSDIQGSVAKVFDFLGLEPLDPYAMMKISEIPVARKGKTGLASKRVSRLPPNLP